MSELGEAAARIARARGPAMSGQATQGALDDYVDAIVDALERLQQIDGDPKLGLALERLHEERSLRNLDSAIGAALWPAERARPDGPALRRALLQARHDLMPFVGLRSQAGIGRAVRARAQEVRVVESRQVARREVERRQTAREDLPEPLRLVQRDLREPRELVAVLRALAERRLTPARNATVRKALLLVALLHRAHLGGGRRLRYHGDNELARAIGMTVEPGAWLMAPAVADRFLSAARRATPERLRTLFAAILSAPPTVNGWLEALLEWSFTVEPVVHFIWFGTGDPNPQNTGFANAIAARLPDVTVRYWCFDGLMPKFRASLSAPVCVCSIEGLLGRVGVAFGVPFRGQVQEILDFYLANRGNAPAKDLLTYLILALCGGYFFDANCTISDWSRFRGAIRPRPFPAFVWMSTAMYFSPKEPSEMDEMELLYVLEGPDTVTYRQTDMWAMYAPPGCVGMERAARHYVKRARALGLFGTSTVGFNALQRGGRTNFVQGSPLEKRGIAGTIGIQSIFTCIHALQNPRGYDLDRCNWATHNTGPESYAVPELGLEKKHGGTW